MRESVQMKGRKAWSNSHVYVIWKTFFENFAAMIRPLRSGLILLENNNLCWQPNEEIL
jgi:hypothetical protein